MDVRVESLLVEAEGLRVENSWKVGRDTLMEYVRDHRTLDSVLIATINVKSNWIETQLISGFKLVSNFRL